VKDTQETVQKSKQVKLKHQTNDIPRFNNLNNMD